MPCHSEDANSDLGSKIIFRHLQMSILNLGMVLDRLPRSYDALMENLSYYFMELGSSLEQYDLGWLTVHCA